MSWLRELRMQRKHGLKAIAEEGCQDDALYVQNINKNWVYNPMPNGIIKKSQRAQNFVRLFLYDPIFNHGSADDEKKLLRERVSMPLSALVDYAA